MIAEIDWNAEDAGLVFSVPWKVEDDTELEEENAWLKEKVARLENENAQLEKSKTEVECKCAGLEAHNTFLLDKLADR